MKIVKNTEKFESKTKISDTEVEEAFRIILKWIGEDPGREGLIETPRRVTKAFKEYFKGYNQEKRSEMLKVMMIWFYKKIYQYQVTVNTIWHQLLVWRTLLTYQKKE